MIQDEAVADQEQKMPSQPIGSIPDEHPNDTQRGMNLVPPAQMQQTLSSRPNINRMPLPAPPPSFEAYSRGVAPMPPPPEGLPKMSDAAAEGMKLTWYKALELNAGFLGNQGLYNVYQTGRARTANKGPGLIRAMAEFVGDAEETMRRLDSLVSQMQQPGARSNQTEPEVVAGPMPVDPFEAGSHPLLQTQFYHCEGVFGFEGEFIEPTDIRHKEGQSHYTSNSDPEYLIRALYGWKEPETTSRRHLGTGYCPDASEITLFGITVTSRPISSFFEKRLGLDAGVASGILKLGMPFKPVIRNRQLLKSQLEKLEQKYGLFKENTKGTESLDSKSNDSQGLPDEDGSNGSLSSDDTENWEFFDHEPALEHFRLLIQFIDDYLGEKMDLFEKLQAGHEETVSYEDLWMLFTNGKKVICPLRENRMSIGNDSDSDHSGSESDDDDIRHVTRRRYVPQAYQVMATIGGSPLKLSLAPQDIDVTSNELKDEYLFQMLLGRRTGIRTQNQAPSSRRAKERFSHLYMICMYVDYDGAKYGTDTEIFVFKPFDGQIQVKSLEAYPLNYFVSPRSNYLSQRGRKFIDVAASPRHMDHTGITIGEVREEVRVDCSPFLVFVTRN